MATVTEQFNKAVDEGVKTGEINMKKHGPLIEVGRKLAGIMDDPDWPIFKGKYDNVSPGTFLKYCEKLGIAAEMKTEKPKKTETVTLVGNSRWKKKA